MFWRGMHAAVGIIGGLLALAITVGFMWGLKWIMFTMGQDFAIGVVFGMGLLMIVLWSYHKATGKDIFTAD